MMMVGEKVVSKQIDTQYYISKDMELNPTHSYLGVHPVKSCTTRGETILMMVDSSREGFQYTLIFKPNRVHKAI